MYGHLKNKGVINLYDVSVCGSCMFERVAGYNPPCNDCSQLKSKAKQSHFIPKDGVEENEDKN